MELKNVVKKFFTIMIITMLLSVFLLPRAMAKESEEINEVQKSGFEDTYLFETTDSIVTTKTELERKIPETFGRYEREEYPIPNVSKTKNQEMYDLIKEENKEIMANIESDIANGTLEKHIAADGQFYGSIANDVKAVEKIAYVNTNLAGSHSLGVYIPAGEIAIVTIPQEFMYLAEQNKISLKVGLTETNAENYSLNSGKENRMPYLGKDFAIKNTTMKIGTPFGGMIYMQVNTSINTGITIPITISGAVDTPYYDLGSTTLEKWEEMRNAPGLYAEFRTPYVRFMMPSSTIRNIENPYDILSFWHNVASLSTYPFGDNSRILPVTMVFDSYVKAGAAVATVGAWICNMPTSWASSSLNYQTYMQSGGWGTMHEFNHHWQGTYNQTGRWGVGDPNEVTNNVMNAASYILYTNIDAYRTENGLTGGNTVANPYSTLKTALKEGENGSPVTTPNMYTSLMHEFGVETFIEIIRSNYFGGTYNNIKIDSYKSLDDRYNDFAYRASVIFGKDLSMYFEEHLNFDLSNETIQKIKQLGFEQYIPVQNVYAVGPEKIETGKPFYILNTDYLLDFEKYTVTTGKIEKIEVGTPIYGKMTKNEDGTYTYIPKADMLENTIDEFNLRITVSEKGITQTRTLICKIGVTYQGTKVEKYELNQANTAKAIEEAKNMKPYNTSYVQSMNYNTDNGYNFNKATGYLTVPADGEYEFQAYGDDLIRFELQVGDKAYSSETKTYTANAITAYDNKNSTHFTVSLKAGESYSYILYANNRGGAGKGAVAYRKANNSNNFANLPTPYLNKEDVGKKTDRSFKQPTPSYQRLLYKVTNKINIDMSKAIVLSTPNAQSGDGSSKEAIIDGNYNTFFHSRYHGGEITPFPHEYIIDLGEQKSFNRFDIYTRSNTNGTIGDYETYTSNDNQNWTKIAEDRNRKDINSASITISKTIDTTTARYFKIVALNNKFGNNFTIISEIELSNEIKNNSKIAQNSSYLKYEGKWNRNAEGNYINGATYNTTSGKMNYSFNGTATAIYSSKDAAIKVKLDKKEQTYTIKGSKYNPSLILNNLTSGKHYVEIEVVSGEFGLNLLTTDGTFINTQIILKGDINFDNKITATDLLLLKRHIVAGNNNAWILTGDKLDAGDMNDNGNISPTDLILLKRLVIEKTK